MKKIIIRLCYWLLKRLDPAHVTGCALSHERFTVDFGDGFLPPDEWTHVAVTMTAWMRPNSNGIASFDLYKNGEKFDEILYRSNLRFGGASTDIKEGQAVYLGGDGQICPCEIHTPV